MSHQLLFLGKGNISALLFGLTPLISGHSWQLLPAQAVLGLVHRIVRVLWGKEVVGYFLSVVEMQRFVTAGVGRLKCLL